MTSDNAEKKVTKVLAFLAALYPKFELTRATIKAYSKILGDIPADRLEAAAEDLGSRSTFFPAASEIRQAAFELDYLARDMPSAYEAWQQVKGAFQGRSRDFHPLVIKTMDQLGGFSAFGQSQVDDEPSWRARFIQAYEINVDRQKRDETMLPQIADHVERLRLEDSEADPESRVRMGIDMVTKRLKGNSQEDS